MLAKQQNNTFHSQESPSVLQNHLIAQDFIQVYKIRVDQIPNPSSKILSEKNIYLSVIFSEPNRIVFHSQCINILKDNKYFQIKTIFDIQKIEVIDYQTLKKLCKIRCKGIKKEFKHSHVEARSGIEIEIQRIHAKITICNKRCKMVESISVQRGTKQKDYESTDDSLSEVSN